MSENTWVLRTRPEVQGPERDSVRSPPCSAESRNTSLRAECFVVRGLYTPGRGTEGVVILPKLRSYCGMPKFLKQLLIYAKTRGYDCRVVLTRVIALCWRFLLCRFVRCSRV
jgi:hypothetical protein